MTELSLIQQYLLCAVKKNGKLPTLGNEKVLCLSAAGVLELLLADVLAFDGKKLTVLAPLPEQKEYLRPVYAWIEKKQPVKFNAVVEHFSFSLTGAAIKELTGTVGDSLVAAGCMQREKGGFLGKEDRYIPQAEAVDRVVQGIRSELLEEGELSEDVVALAVLLNKSGELARYFSAYEKDALKKRLKEIRENPQSEIVRKAAEYIDSLFLMIIVATT